MPQLSLKVINTPNLEVCSVPGQTCTIDAVFTHLRYLDHLHKPSLVTFGPTIPVSATPATAVTTTRVTAGLSRRRGGGQHEAGAQLAARDQGGPRQRARALSGGTSGGEDNTEAV